MKITGSAILDKLSDLKRVAMNTKDEFEASLTYYESDGEEDRENPLDALARYEALELQIAKIEDVQTALNLEVKVTINGVLIPLNRAVHLITEVAYTKNKWEAQSKSAKDDPYGYSRGRNKDVELPKRSITVKDAKAFAAEASKTHGIYKGAIRKGNQVAVDLEGLLRKFGIEGVDTSWFEDQE